MDAFSKLTAGYEYSDGDVKALSKSAAGAASYLSAEELQDWLIENGAEAQKLQEAWAKGVTGAEEGKGGKKKKERGKTAAERRVYQVFLAMDMDNDGILSTQELTDGLAKAGGVDLDSIEMEEVLTELDAEAGHVDYEKFETWLMSNSIVSAKVKVSAFKKFNKSKVGIRGQLKNGLKTTRKFVQRPSVLPAVRSDSPAVYGFLQEATQAFALLDDDEDTIVRRADLEVLAEVFGAEMSNNDQKDAMDEMDPEIMDEITWPTFLDWLKGQESSSAAMINDSFNVTLEHVKGEAANIYGTVCDQAAFDTVRASKEVTEGKWYYEILLGDKGCCQIGFAQVGFHIRNKRNGVGDKETEGKSWGFDGHRQLKWCGGEEDYDCKVWKTGDVVGCLLDLELGEVSFSLNGTDLGVAFNHVRAASKVTGEPAAIYPCATLKHGPHTWRFAANKMQHCPPGYKPFTLAADYKAFDLESMAVEALRGLVLQHGPAWEPSKDYDAFELVGKTIDYQGKGLGEVMEDTKSTAKRGHVVKWADPPHLSKLKLEKKSMFLVMIDDYVNQYVDKNLNQAVDDFKVCFLTLC